MKKPLSILDQDLWPVGHLAFYCLRDECTESKWPSGDKRIMTRDHFDDLGRCKGRPATEPIRKPRGKHGR